jgi:hypothetical protein
MFLLLSIAWAAAQDMPAQSPSVGTPNQTQPQTPLGDQSQMPSSGQAPSNSDQAVPPAAAGQITEGCLGGTEPNYTITDKAGTVYKLDMPKGVDTTVLSKHVGESVQVMGDVSGADSKSSAASAGASGASKSIQVAKIGRGKGTCPASGAESK